MNNKLIKEIWDYIKVVIIAMILATLISTQIFTFSQVQQRSMERTLIEGDTIIIEKVSLHFSSLERGDIIVLLQGEEVDNSFFGRIERLYSDMYYKFKKMENKNRLVKRVIGLPGDEIDIRDGKLFVNGQAQDETYVTSETYTRSIPMPLSVPDNQIFVLGDNREVSEDSREFGCVKLQNVEGIAVFRFFPFHKIGTLD